MDTAQNQLHQQAHIAVEKIGYMRYLLFIAGMGGLLYGIDIGIIAGALPYLESTASVMWKLSAQQLSFIVAAVLLGSVFSSLFAGMLADVIGRKWVMFLSGFLFTLSIPVIALSDGYTPLLLGRLLQGISGGLIGVVIPLYLAECLGANNRGRGTGIFQLMLTIGLVVAAVIGWFYAKNVEQATQTALAISDLQQQSAQIFAAKNQAWRDIFWISLSPGILFTLGTLFLTESPRWLVAKGRINEARKALQKSRNESAANAELSAIQASLQNYNEHDKNHKTHKNHIKEALFQRRYVMPFLLTCIILACTQATGINSILAYAVNILNNAGLSGSDANSADVALKVLNALMTVVAVLLVDKKGRKFLLMLGSGGIFVSLVLAGLLFMNAEQGRSDVKAQLQQQVQQDSLEIRFDPALLKQLAIQENGQAQQLSISYSYGEFTNVQTRRSDAIDLKNIVIQRADVVQADSVIGKFFRNLHLNPFADPAQAQQAPLVITQAFIGPVPSATHGWLVASCIFAFVAFFAVGPGVCVWLALSELMPTRIRSNGMSIALLINQFVSTSIATVFLPTVGNYGYSTMFFFWAACTIVYFLCAAFWLPETKGKTLEEIEAHFIK